MKYMRRSSIRIKMQERTEFRHLPFGGWALVFKCAVSA
jgi:hypothetical protein